MTVTEREQATISSSIRECEAHIERLEQLGLVQDVGVWQRFRNLRNNLAYDYPESRDQTVATINELFDSWRELAQMFDRARQEYRRRETPA